MQAFVQGGGSKIDAIWGYSTYVAGPDGPITDSEARVLTLNGYSWGDNEGDSIHIMNGYDYY